MAALAAPGAAVHAQAADPGAAQIETLNSALLDLMKGSRALGPEGRYRKILPAVQQAYDLPVMTRFAVGPKWATLSPQDQSALIQSFARLTAASYAHNFDGYSGERFVVDPDVQNRGPDKLVRSHILSNDKPVDLTYRMRQSSDGKWKIIDVYYNGSISELTTRRSDFSSSIDSGGAPALLKKIDALADKLMK
jgi:phospholipid transport system substrate-binding protein